MAGSLISSGLHDTMRTNGTPAVSSAGNATTLSSTITSGRVRSMISVSCCWQYRAPLISSSHTGLMNPASCSIAGLRNLRRGAADELLPKLPGILARRPAGAGGARSTSSSSKPSGSSRPCHEASAANTTRCPRRRNTSPTPMQLFVGPYALSGMNKIVSGRSAMAPPPAAFQPDRSIQYGPGAGVNRKPARTAPVMPQRVRVLGRPPG